VSGSLISMAVILVAALVVTGVVAAKNEKLRTKLVGVGLGIAGALAAVVALLTLNKEKKRAAEIASSTKEVKTGRKDAKEDARETEKELDSAVGAEVDAHEEAAGEQEDLKEMKRERLKS
jgi:hypothetical protein